MLSTCKVHVKTLMSSLCLCSFCSSNKSTIDKSDAESNRNYYVKGNAISMNDLYVIASSDDDIVQDIFNRTLSKHNNHQQSTDLKIPSPSYQPSHGRITPTIIDINRNGLIIADRCRISIECRNNMISYEGHGRTK